VTELVGREREAELLAQLVAGVAGGRSEALMIRGDVGVGKSALLDFAVGSASGFAVLRTQGVASESQIPFAGLQELFAPMTHLVSSLPSRQGEALRGALGMSPPLPADPLAVLAATVGLVASAAKDAPLVVAVDDAHWLDPASGQALAFAARRLESDSVLLLLAARSNEPSAFDDIGLRELELLGLDEPAARQLLARRLGRPIVPEVADELVAIAAGNPLALLELPAELSDSQLTGRQPIAQPLRVRRAVQNAFAGRVRRLPERCQRALLLLAADAGGDPETVAAAMTLSGLGPNDVEPAEAIGLVEVGGGDIRFRHPLVRSAVYQGATPPDRRAAHTALAAALDERPDQRAWHLAAAAAGPTEDVAVELERAGGSAAARGGLVSAARAYERAAGLSTSQRERVRRLLAAGGYARASGQIAWAAELARTGRPIATGPGIRADYQWLEAEIERDRGSLHTAAALLRRAAGDIAGVDLSRAALMMVDATITEGMRGDFSQAAENGKLAMEFAANQSSTIRDVATLATEVIATFQGDASPADSSATEIWERLAVAHELPIAARVSAEILWTSWFALAGAEWLPDSTGLEELIAQRREQGALSTLPFLLSYAAVNDFNHGRWTRAGAGAREAAELASQTGQMSQRSAGLLQLASVEAARGLTAECLDHVREARLLAEPSDTIFLEVWASATIGLLHLGQMAIDEATMSLTACERQARHCGIGHPGVGRYQADLVETLILSGRPTDAVTASHLLEQQARRAHSRWGAAAAARCRGLLASDSEFEAEFETALILHDAEPSAFERARTQLCYGERLRRARRISEARTHLAAALSCFDQHQASPWSERARNELAAAGSPSAPRVRSTTVESLTPQELRVALIVSAGATVAEAATQLFLSPKTIEAHLGRTYRKLGIRNRAQLALVVMQSDVAVQ
jgi:DNA-binding CsgD family transcriptional regulator